MTSPWLLTTDGPRVADVRVLWVLPPRDVAALRRIAAEVQRLERERRAVAQRKNTD